ncbi:ABC transporter substrate-binding protein [Rhodovastum atsumiense]|nr:ABC transporter substrate-binding protein [Rhodovastum atsumiense]CAH2598891.1 ABC transporter substrate-binding protein [Rhodovastum atsumiense]
MLHSRLTLLDDGIPAAAIRATAPRLSTLDFLGRMPVPLRHGFAAGLERAAAAAGGRRICFLMGHEWYAPFDDMLRAGPLSGVPHLVVSPFTRDLLSPPFQQFLRAAGHCAGPAAPVHPAVAEAGLVDPEGLFSVFAVIPWVFLIDLRKLAGRAVPRRWEDLLDPAYHRQIVFGGWRRPSDGTYPDCNDFLLLTLHRRFGVAGLRAFAANTRAILHNTAAARFAGTGSEQGGAISILPWMQADMCPHRDRTMVVWPEDGAMTMPIGSSVSGDHRGWVQPLIDYLSGDALGRFLAQNRYPPTSGQIPQVLPPGAKLHWIGWDYTRSHDMTEETNVAMRIFFDAWDAG